MRYGTLRLCGLLPFLLLASGIASAEGAAPAGAKLPEGATAYAAVDPGAAPVSLPAPAVEAPIAAEPPAPDPDAGLLRRVVDTYRKGDIAGGDRLRAELKDTPARAAAEWAAIRSGLALGFERIAGFFRTHADWPTDAVIRRRAEESLLSEKKPPATVRAFFAARRPTSAAGKLALAVALRADGLDRDAAGLVRESWRQDLFGREFEARIIAAFPDTLTQADHRGRMERALFKENWETASRAAARAGKEYATLVKARRLCEGTGKKTTAAFDAVPAALRSDTSYLFSRAHHLRKTDKAADAAKLIAGMTRDPDILADGDEWWVERRLIARKLLDSGDAKTAYEVVKDHGARALDKRIEAEFHAGWIALRFLSDAATAAGHFAEAASYAETPISLARTAYWQGRAAEAQGQADAARGFYERAAAQPITYYGQLARVKLGVRDLPLRAATEATRVEERAAFERRAPAQGVRLLSAAGHKDLTLALYAGLASHLKSAPALEALADAALAQNDPRAVLTIGKTAVQRGYPLDSHAYPTVGIPAFDAVSAVTPVEKAMIYAIARQESAFDPRAQSGAGARGLMQLMPATARRTAQNFGLSFDQDRLLDDPAYNAKLGSAHLSELMQDWRGSYILAFASYNAGGGNVKKWIDAYGDPRSPGIDPVDWVERIPFSETRNYVQRVMENLQVYRRRLDEKSALLIESDFRRGAR